MFELALSTLICKLAMTDTQYAALQGLAEAKMPLLWLGSMAVCSTRLAKSANTNQPLARSLLCSETILDGWNRTVACGQAVIWSDCSQAWSA